MKLIYFSILPALCFVGCATYSITTENAHDIDHLPAYCENATFVASDYIDVSTAPPSESVSAQSLLTMARVLKFTKAKYGEDITVMNLRYDRSNDNKNIAVTFDVVCCP